METGATDFGCARAHGVLRVVVLGAMFFAFTLLVVQPVAANPPPFFTYYYSPYSYSNYAPAKGIIYISGSNFTGATSVTVGSLSLSFTVKSDGQITATIPNVTSIGSGKITVTTPYGSFTSEDDFVYGPIPANDKFANAIDLGTANNMQVTGNNLQCSFEPTEHVVDTNTVWWKWTASADNTIQVIDTTGSGSDTVLNVYTGTSLSTLTPIRQCDNVAADGHSRVAFPAVKNTVYYIRVATVRKWSYVRFFAKVLGGSISLQFASYGTPSTVADHLIWARALTESDRESQFHNKVENLVAANSHVDAALALDSSNGEANLLKALLRIALLQRQGEFAQLMAALNITETSGNVIHPHYKPTRDAAGDLQFNSGANSSVVLNYLQNVVIPTLDQAEVNLSRVPTDFSTCFSDAEAMGTYILVDYADVQVLRAMIQGIKAASAFSEAYDLAFSLEQASQLAKAKKTNIEYYKLSYANLLKFAKSEKRIQFSNAIHAASEHYDAAATWAGTHRSIPTTENQLFTISESTRTTLSNLATSFDHEVVWDGNRINLSALLNTATPLRDLLGGFKDNKLIANTLPDPTFAGCYPDGNLTTVENVMSRNKMLVQLSNYAAWAAAYLPGGSTQTQSPTANPAGDGISNRMKYIFGLDPKVSHRTSEFMVTAPVKDTATNKTYLTLHFVRRVDVSTITYTVSVSDDLKTWDSTGTQVEQVGVPVRNDDGLTETVTVRIKTDIALTTRKFMRIEATDTTM